MMSRKHYEQIAKVLNQAFEHASFFPGDVHPIDAARATATMVAADLAYMFEQDNPNFDRDKFMAACIPPIGKVKEDR